MRPDRAETADGKNNKWKPRMTGDTKPHYEAIVVGAGVAGIYQIKRLADLGIEATVLEAGGDLGGTWYWNRYPGARFDSESYTYGYSFSRELLDEWHWKERFSGQPENLRYLNYVADKFDLRKHMQFNCRVEAARYDEAQNLWRLRLGDGRELTCRFLILTLGLLSMPTLPRLEGMDELQGPLVPHLPLAARAGRHGGQAGRRDRHRRHRHPGDRRDRRQGRRAHRVPAPAELERAAQQRADLRDARWPTSAARYDEIFAACARTPGGFVHEPDRRGFYEVTPRGAAGAVGQALRRAGLRHLAGELPRDLHRREGQRRVLRVHRRPHPPAGQGSRGRREADPARPRLRRAARAAGDQLLRGLQPADNVHLVDISETPLVRVTETGLRTTERDYEFDIIVYATGFDAITGAFDKIDIQGAGGVKLADKWRTTISTFLGMMVHGFPNLLMPTGPQSGSASTNYPRGIETGVNWCTDLLEYMLGQRLHAGRGDAKRPSSAGPTTSTKHVRHDADAQGQVVVHRLQLQCAGPRAGHHPLPRLQRRRAEVRGRHQRRGGQGL